MTRLSVYYIFLTLFVLISSSWCQQQQQSEVETKSIRIKNLTECIEPFAQAKSTTMQAPYFLVPIQPDDSDELARLVRFDADSGQVCFHPSATHSMIKFTILSINQGTALNLEITLADASRLLTTTSKPASNRQVNITHYIPSLTQTRRSARLVITCEASSTTPSNSNSTRIDPHIIYATTATDDHHIDVDYHLFTRLVTRVSQTEVNVVVRCVNDELEYIYTLRLSDPDENYFLKSSSLENVVFQLRKPPPPTQPTTKTSSSAPIRHVTSPAMSSSAAIEITRTAAKLATLTFNFKMFTILAITLASLLAVLIYVVFLTLTRFMRAKASLFSATAAAGDGAASMVDSCATTSLDTRSSILMNEIQSQQQQTQQRPVLSNQNHMKHSLDVAGLFSHSSFYLGQLGIDATSNLRHLLDQQQQQQSVLRNCTFMVTGSKLPNNNTVYLDGSGTMTSSSISGASSSYCPPMNVVNTNSGDLHAARWHHMLDWNVDFNSMSDVFDDLVRLK